MHVHVAQMCGKAFLVSILAGVPSPRAGKHSSPTYSRHLACYVQPCRCTPQARAKLLSVTSHCLLVFQIVVLVWLSQHDYRSAVPLLSAHHVYHSPMPFVKRTHQRPSTRVQCCLHPVHEGEESSTHNTRAAPLSPPPMPTAALAVPVPPPPAPGPARMPGHDRSTRRGPHAARA